MEGCHSDLWEGERRHNPILQWQYWTGSFDKVTLLRPNVDIKLGSHTTGQYNHTVMTSFASTLHIVGVHSYEDMTVHPSRPHTV